MKESSIRTVCSYAIDGKMKDRTNIDGRDKRISGSWLTSEDFQESHVTMVSSLVSVYSNSLAAPASWLNSSHLAEFPEAERMRR